MLHQPSPHGVHGSPRSKSPLINVGLLIPDVMQCPNGLSRIQFGNGALFGVEHVIGTVAMSTTTLRRTASVGFSVGTVACGTAAGPSWIIPFRPTIFSSGNYFLTQALTLYADPGSSMSFEGTARIGDAPVTLSVAIQGCSVRLP
jgi:hypothetical protein